MKVRFFGCGRFAWLASESEDRELSEAEVRFMGLHREVCPSCARREEASTLALNMLREARLEAVEPDAAYDVRLIRRWRVQNMRSSVRYWSPAVLGAAIAAVTLISALQMFARSSELPVFSAGASEARRIPVERLEIPNIPIAHRISLPH
jgi:hypothetical protein